MNCEHLQRLERYLENYQLSIDGTATCTKCTATIVNNGADNLQVLQAEHKEWVDRNFPNQKPYHGLLGVVEEVGELSHAYLKREQGIRGSQEKHTADIDDAIGDIIIYLASFCNTNEISLARCVKTAMHHHTVPHDPRRSGPWLHQVSCTDALYPGWC